MIETLQSAHGFNLRGDFKAIAVYSDGKVETLVDEKNLIIKQAKIDFLKYLYINNLVSDPITTFKLGTGGALDPQGLFPKEPSPTQTDLNTPVVSIPVTANPTTDEAGVTFLMDLDEATGNGLQLTEAGLFMLSGKIFNVKNFPAILKQAEFALHFEWQIKIV